MGLAVTVSTTQEVTLKPSVKAKLLRELHEYANAKQLLEIAQTKVDKHKAIVAAIREDIGEQSISLDGYTVTLVAGTKSKLDKGKLVAQGVSLAQIEMATVVSPSKAYVLITLPSVED